MKLNYRKSGEGKPLFILHGLFGLSDNWASLGKVFSEHYEVFLIDLRNHGSSPHSSEWTYTAMAQDIKELTEDALPHSKINLMGHSLGGKTAMQFASMYPEKLDALMVVDMAPKEYPGNQFPFIDKLLKVDLSILKSRKEAEGELNKIIRDWATIQLLLKNIQWNEHEKLEWKFNLKIIAEQQDQIGKTFQLNTLPITIPTLFVRGEKSNYVKNEDEDQIKKLFPNSKLITIMGAGHWVHADKPTEFAQCIDDFLSNK